MFPIHVILLASAYFGNVESGGLYFPDDEKITAEEESTQSFARALNKDLELHIFFQFYLRWKTSKRRNILFNLKEINWIEDIV
jgi:predicted small lipoprotein YifL